MNEPEQRDPGLDRAYREAPRDEPPPELDERIRAAARRAVSAGPQSLEERSRDERRRSWVTRWRVPLSVAATVAIAVGLTLRMQEVERAPAYDGAPAAPAVPPPTDAPRPAAPSAPDAARRAPVPATAPAERQVPTTRADPQSAAQPAAPPAESAPRPMREERAKEAEQPAAADSAARSSNEQLEMRRQTPVPAAASPVPAAAPPAAAATPPAPAATPLPSLRAAPKPAPPAGAAADGLSRDRALGDRPGRAMRESSAAGVRTPETWLEQIRSLRAQGRETEAAAELAEFRRAYPDYRLPADLGGPKP